MKFKSVGVRTILAFVFLFLLTACGSAGHNMTRDEAGMKFSGALSRWRNYVDFCSAHDDRRRQFCETAISPPVSWRYVMTSISDAGYDPPPQDFESPWDSDANRWYREESGVRGVFSFSKNPPVSEWSPFTKVMALRGEGAAFDAVCDGKKVQDLEKDTIVLCEVRDSQIHWMQPGDLDISTLPREINPRGGLGISGNYPGGIFVGFADGNVWFVRDTVPFEDLEKFFTLENAQNHDREAILGKYVIEKFPPWEELTSSR